MPISTEQKLSGHKEHIISTTSYKCIATENIYQ